MKCCGNTPSFGVSCQSTWHSDCARPKMIHPCSLRVETRLFSATRNGSVEWKLSRCTEPGAGSSNCALQRCGHEFIMQEGTDEIVQEEDSDEARRSSQGLQVCGFHLCIQWAEPWPTFLPRQSSTFARRMITLVPGRISQVRPPPPRSFIMAPQRKAWQRISNPHSNLN